MSLSTRQTPLWLAIVVLLVAMASYQCGAAVAERLFPQVGAQGATAFRLGLGALVLLLLRQPWRRWRKGADWRALWGYGLSMGAMNLVFYLALEFTGPLAIALFGSRRLLDVAWVVLVVIGLALLLPLHRADHALDPVGVAYALAAGLGWALYILFGKQAGAAYGGDAVTWGIAIGALLAVPAGAVHAGAALLSPALLLPGLGVAVLSSVLPYSLEMIALTRLPARHFSVLLSLEPAIAALAGDAFLGERLGPLQWLAIAAIVAASAGTAYTARSPVVEPLAE
jgi:inner membrane transporter RhtA